MNAQSSMHPTDVALRNFSLGKVDEGTAESINSHLTRCAECQLKVAEISSDSFLGRLRDARVKPAVSLPVQSATDGSPDDKGRPQPYVQPETLPPDLAEHADYQILRELGRGGMGVVYLAHNRLMGRDEVLKVVSKHLIERKGVLERFSREIRSAARLMHPNIVHAYSAFRLGESIVFAMEYVEGLDLAKLVKTKGPLPVLHSCNFAYQAALGLQHAHEQGMVHRDIKPGNLMLSRKGNKAVVKVLDFGLAKATRESPLDGALTHQGQMLGTPDFIAPEQIRDAQSAGIQADVYSLGCTLYYLLTGAPPFAATSLYDLLQAHFSMDAAPLNLVRPEVPFELAALIAKMMAKDLNRRFQTPEEVAEALKPFFKSTAPGSPASDAQMSRPGSPRGSTQTTTSGPARAPAATGATHPMTSGRDRSEPTAAVVIWEDLIQIDRGEPAINTTEAQSPEATAPTAGGRVRRRSWRRPAILGASLFGALAMGVTLFVVTDKGRIKIVVDGRSPVVSIDGRTIRIEGLDEPITLRAGEHVLTVERGGVEVETRKFRIHRGNNPEIRIEYEPKVNDRTTPDRAKAPSIEAASTDAAPPEQTDRGDTDRRAADAALSLGGSVTIVVNGRARTIQPGQALPAEPFELTQIHLENQKRLTNDALKSFEGLGHLSFINLSRDSNVTDAGVAHLLDLPKLERLELDRTGVTDAGLVHLKGLANLESLGLGRTRVTDAGLVHLQGLKHLKELELTGTSVTLAGIKWLVDSTPSCKVTADRTAFERDPRSPGGTTSRDGFVPLFNHADLNGWEHAGPKLKGQWTVFDGRLEGRGVNGVATLATKRQDFRDYRLRVVYSSPKDGYGRIELRRSGTEKNTSGYWVSLGIRPHRELHDWPAGNILKMRNYAYGWAFPLGRNSQDAHAIPNSRHTLEIEVLGDRVTTSLDGDKTDDFTDMKEGYRSGAIAVHCTQGSIVRFEEVSIQELPHAAKVSGTIDLEAAPGTVGSARRSAKKAR